MAAATPAPGGGSASAVTCAVAAGLVEMAAGFGGAGAGDVQLRAAELRARALELADVELSAYEPVLVAIRLPASDPHRDRRVTEARLSASDSPLQIAEVGAELASLGAQTARRCSRHLVGDAVAGAVLAEAACAAAVRLVEINLEGSDEGLRLRRAAALRTDAAAAREWALAVSTQRSVRERTTRPAP